VRAPAGQRQAEEGAPAAGDTAKAVVSPFRLLQQVSLMELSLQSDDARRPQDESFHDYLLQRPMRLVVEPRPAVLADHEGRQPDDRQADHEGQDLHCRRLLMP
jgi:hypothetical protein